MTTTSATSTVTTRKPIIDAAERRIADLDAQIERLTTERRTLASQVRIMKADDARAEAQAKMATVVYCDGQALASSVSRRLFKEIGKTAKSGLISHGRRSAGLYVEAGSTLVRDGEHFVTATVAYTNGTWGKGDADREQGRLEHAALLLGDMGFDARLTGTYVTITARQGWR